MSSSSWTRSFCIKLGIQAAVKGTTKFSISRGLCTRIDPPGPSASIKDVDTTTCKPVRSEKYTESGQATKLPTTPLTPVRARYAAILSTLLSSQSIEILPRSLE